MKFYKRVAACALSLLLIGSSFSTLSVQAAKKNATTSKKITKRVVRKQVKKTTKKKTIVRKTNVKRKYSRGSGSYLAQGDNNAIVDIAKSFLGTRYVYGGTTPRGFDCSGFTQYVYRIAGVNLPRTASDQSKVGVAVDKSNLMPGDLVFFQTVTNGISHVGIYIGNGNFIHASSGSKHKVTITSLSSSYYINRYRGAVRIMK